MPRNGSGTMIISNSFSSGTTISSSLTNANNADIASEITGSLPRNGEAGMTAQLGLSNGTAAAPGVAFSSDADTGIYRVSAGKIGVACDGAQILDVSSTGLSVTGALASTGTASSAYGHAATPVGAISDFAGSTAPTGWLLCYGQAVSRTTYASLFAVISTTYGAGDSSTTFNLPDCRGRVAAGYDSMGGSSANRLTGLSNGVDGDTIGNTGGSESVTIAALNLPDHTVTITDTHTHTYGRFSSTFDCTLTGASSQTVDIGSSSQATTTASGGAITAAFGSSARGGSQTAHNLVQPTIIFNKIIYAAA